MLVPRNRLEGWWYPGTEGGTAVAETVFGLNNPGGKLPISFPRSEGAIPCYYHALRDRGNYVDVEGSARYPFGHGLSYTTFSLTPPKLDGNRISVEITNTGKVKGGDVDDALALACLLRDGACDLLGVTVEAWGRSTAIRRRTPSGRFGAPPSGSVVAYGHAETLLEDLLGAAE